MPAHTYTLKAFRLFSHPSPVFSQTHIMENWLLSGSFFLSVPLFQTLLCLSVSSHCNHMACRCWIRKYTAASSAGKLLMSHYMTRWLFSDMPVVNSLSLSLLSYVGAFFLFCNVYAIKFWLKKKNRCQNICCTCCSQNEK